MEADFYKSEHRFSVKVEKSPNGKIAYVVKVSGNTIDELMTSLEEVKTRTEKKIESWKKQSTDDEVQFLETVMKAVGTGSYDIPARLKNRLEKLKETRKQ